LDNFNNISARKRKRKKNSVWDRIALKHWLNSQVTASHRVASNSSLDPVSSHHVHHYIGLSGSDSPSIDHNDSLFLFLYFLGGPVLYLFFIIIVCFVLFGVIIFVLMIGGRDGRRGCVSDKNDKKKKKKNIRKKKKEEEANQKVS
jgi:hypothetical protein